MNGEPNRMRQSERAAALAVIAQYGLSEEAQALAMERVNERARYAPFDRGIAYIVAHMACAEAQWKESRQ